MNDENYLQTEFDGDYNNVISQFIYDMTMQRFDPMTGVSDSEGIYMSKASDDRRKLYAAECVAVDAICELLESRMKLDRTKSTGRGKVKYKKGTVFCKNGKISSSLITTQFDDHLHLAEDIYENDPIDMQYKIHFDGSCCDYYIKNGDIDLFYKEAKRIQRKWSDWKEIEVTIPEYWKHSDSYSTDRITCEYRENGKRVQIRYEWLFGNEPFYIKSQASCLPNDKFELDKGIHIASRRLVSQYMACEAEMDIHKTY